MIRLAQCFFPALSLALLLSIPLVTLASQWQRFDQRGLNPASTRFLPDAVVAMSCLAIAVVSVSLFCIPDLSTRPRTLQIRSALIYLGLWMLFNENLVVRMILLVRPYVFLAVLLLFAILAAAIFLHIRLEAANRLETAQKVLLLVMLPAALGQVHRQVNFRFPLAGAPAPVENVSSADSKLSKPPGKIVVLIFDELDGSVAFRKRPASLQLPNFDRLSREAAVFEHAYPAEDWTVLAIPAFLTGQSFDKTVISDRSTYLMRERQTNRWLRLQSEDRIISPARKALGRVDIFGWFLPYCQLFESAADLCEQAPFVPMTWEARLHQLLEQRTFPVMLRAVWDYYSLAMVGKSLADRRWPYHWDKVLWQFARETYSNWLVNSMPALRKSLESPGSSLVWIHLPLPHPPSLTSKRSYLSSVAHADAILGTIRESLETSGQWDSTSLVVTSDHALRPFWWDFSVGDELDFDRAITDFDSVPMMVRFPGQTAPIRISDRTSNAYVHEILKGLLSGRLNPGNLAENARVSEMNRPPRLHAFPF